MDNEIFEIVKAYGCDNIVETVVKSRTWINYSIMTMTFEEAWEKAEECLKNYFNGNNEDNLKIPFNHPIVVEIKPSGGPACESTYNISAILPYGSPDIAPKPKISNLSITKWSDFKVYARPFLANNTEQEFHQESVNFIDLLSTVKLNFISEPYYWVMCSPTSLEKENAQIWFKVNDS